MGNQYVFVLSENDVCFDDIDEHLICIQKTPYVGLMKFLSKYMTEEERERFLAATLPHIVRLIEMCEHTNLVYNRTQQDATVKLSLSHVASIVACGILCLFTDPPDNIEISGVNFVNFYLHTTRTYQRAKFRCILNYVYQLSQHVNHLKGFLEFQRVVVPPQCLITVDDLLNCDRLLCPLIVCPDGKIEDSGSRVLQMDFANAYIGGGVLFDGNVQEEILFSLCPELLSVMLFVEKMEDNEAILIQGHKKYSDSVGYGALFRFAPKNGQNESSSEDYDGVKSMRLNRICAIDATPYDGSDPGLQYEQEQIMREFNKAYAGFKQPDSKQWTDEELKSHQSPELHTEAWATSLDPEKVRAIATGNWGCGVFGGDAQLKAMLQWLVASYASCPAMVYYTFQLFSSDYFDEVVRALGPAGSGWKIKDLAKELFNYAERYNQCNFFQVLLKNSEKCETENKQMNNNRDRKT